ncbi:MAG: ABC transporter ATP-binding protein [Bacteroidetes bacterium]|nr:ABC transporter ATP-binding protein [Bacteroidota bacterium]
MIAFKNINKSFGRLKALHDVNLDCNSGSTLALIGPNGCGKTTLIKSLLGMVVPDSGQILFNGKSIYNEHLYRNSIGYMPQIGRYPDNMTIGQIIDMIQEIRQPSKPIDDQLYRLFDLKNMADKKMRTLSGGTTQKVSATLAFMFNPDVLILDEPTAGLDPLASEILKEKIIQEKKAGKLILITSHLLSELDEMVNGIIFMQAGKIVFKKEVELIKTETGEDRLSKAIAKILKSAIHV